LNYSPLLTPEMRPWRIKQRHENTRVD